ncbi:MAG TPA: 5'-3' exonuclease [Candidatus Limnocylindria bacterium]
MAPGATLLIDGSSLAYRAYHAIPVITAPDRVTETNAVHGFLNFLSRLIPDRRPSRLWVALDADWRPAFRVDALASYKAHRVAGADDPPDPVEPQIALIIEVLGAFGVSTARAEGYEAEDAIASIAKRTDGQVEVVTGDRDLFALCRYPHVRVLYTLRGVSELAPVDQAWIHAKYGIPGDRYMDYAILRGDPSDGLPGVAGIGEKTASELLRKYGSLDGILAARDLSPTIRAKLHRGAEYLVGARTVVALAEDCPVEGGTGEIPTLAADDARLRALQDRLGIAAPLERLRAAIRLASAPA